MRKKERFVLGKRTFRSQKSKHFVLRIINIELMNRPLEDYLQKKQKIRITGGVFRGKEGCIMRLHRNTRLVFAFGNMTVAVSYLHAFPFEKIE